MALCKSMLMDMLELAFLLEPEATCNDTKDGRANPSVPHLIIVFTGNIAQRLMPCVTVSLLTL